MRRFLYRTAFFLLPLLLLAVAAECFVRSIPNSYRLKDEWMRRHADEVETLILGNSHAYYDICPQTLGGMTFNLANVSQVASYDLDLLLHYAPMVRLRQVVLVADNSYLFDPPLELGEPYRCAYYTIYMGAGPHSRWGSYGMELFQFDGFCKKVRAYCSGDYAMCDSLGWGCDYKASQSTFDPYDTLAIRHRLQNHVCKDWQWAEANASRVEDIARYCQKHGICLTVVQTPVCEVYNKGIPERQRLFIRQLMERLQTAYGVVVLDYASDSRFFASDFFDADHLSDRGAAKFTSILSKDIR